MDGWARLLRSFGHAIEGIVYTVKTQRNMRIHLAAAAGALLLSWGLGVPRAHVLLVFFSILLVFIFELMNTAIETTVDLVVSEYHPLAKIAKDAAAGAVLLAAIAAVVVGFYVFFNPLLALARTVLAKF